MSASLPSREPARRLGVGLAAAVLATTAACYRYSAVPVTDLSPAMEVRVQLSAVAVDRLRRGPDSVAKLVDGFQVSGTVSELRGDSLVLAVPTTYMEANVRLQTQLHSLALLRSDLQQVTSRRLDKRRTTWTGVAIGIVGAAAVAYVLDHNSRSSGSTPKPPDPKESVLLPVR
jgi:hypothetical protein